jgi:asparagine synthase (glutamine-hydrolysing)
MCGINGLVVHQSTLPQFDIVNAVVKMNQAIIHRGPDHHEVWSSQQVALGHCRLAIQDLSSAGNQPFIKDDYVIVFNGEIYNFNQLKTELTDVEFISNTDTEVLLETWRRFGAKALTKLRGMFAFALYQLSTKRLILARDHFGIKPLYYYHQDGIFAFSSELKALETFGLELEVNQAVIAESLLLCWIRDSQCIYKEVQKLAPGHYLDIDEHGKVAAICYWQAQDLLIKTPVARSEQQWVDALDTVLQDSVQAHLVADVPVSAFLSGGLDSSVLVAMASRDIPDISCYTIKFRQSDQKFEKMADDHFYATKVARDLGVKLETIEVTPNLAHLLEKVVHHLDEPIGDSAAINTYLICEAAHHAGVKVLLSGTGADEVFGGYRKHLASLYAGRYRQLPSICRKSIQWAVNQLPSAGAGSGFRTIRWAKKFLSFADMDESAAFLRSYSYYDFSKLEHAFTAPVASHLAMLASSHSAGYQRARALRGLIDAMCYTDTTNFMVGLNLHYTDRASMAYSAEVRVPFVDKEVIKFGFQLPEQLKIKGGQQKYALKKVAERYLAHDIVYRPKSPFTLPLRAWIRNELDDLVSEFLLSESGLAGRGMFRPEFLKNLVAEERSMQQDHAQQIWHLLTLEQWLRNKSRKTFSI